MVVPGIGRLSFGRKLIEDNCFYFKYLRTFFENKIFNNINFEINLICAFMNPLLPKKKKKEEHNVN